MRLPLAHITPALLLLSAIAGLMATWVPWFQVDTYASATPFGAMQLQSSTPLRPLPDLFHGSSPPYVLGNPPSSGILLLLLFGPPALTLLLALAAWFAARRGTPGPLRWLELACLCVGLLGLGITAYLAFLFTDPFHFHELGVEYSFVTSAQAGLAFAVGAGIGTIAAGVILPLSRRALRENVAVVPV